MPIASGRKGLPGALAIPGDRFLRTRPFRSLNFSALSPFITGITKDSTGTPLASCTVHLFRTWDDGFVSQTVSDGSGNFTFYPTCSGPFYVVAYLPGAPDVAGTTVNTLVAVNA